MKRILFFAGTTFVIAPAFVMFNFNIASNASTFVSFADEFNSRAAVTKPSADETAGIYNFDWAHTYIGFRIKHLGLNEVPGAFRDFNGTINYDLQDVTKSSVNFLVDATKNKVKT